MPTARDKVRDALQKCCKEAPSPGQILFRINFTAAHIAKVAGVSESTARQHLNNLAQYRGYSKRRVHGTYGYRYDEDYA